MKRLASLTLIITLLISALWCPTIAYSAGILYEDLGLYFDAETGTITDCDESLEGILIIPEKIDGVTVTRIGDRAFEYCELLTEVKIPNTVTHIGTLAFDYCYNLTEMTIPKSVVSCGEGTWFINAHSLKKVIFEEGTTEILAKCMWGTDSVEEVYIPSTVKKIGRYAFYWCTALKSVTLPQGLEVLDWYCFEGCHALESIDIPSSVKEIGLSAFDGCIELDKVTLHEGLEVIGGSAFYNCYELTHINFPSTLKSIGVYAFTGDPLKNVLLPKGVENSKDGGWFWGITKVDSVVFEDGTTHVVQGALDGAYIGVVYIPDSVETIGYGALDATIDMVYAPEAVMDQAIDYGHDFVVTKEITEYENFVFENTDFEMSIDTMVGYIPFTTKYEFKEGFNTQNRRLFFRIPEQVTLMENTLRVNGEAVSEYSYDFNELIIYNVPEKAELTFSVKPHEYSDFALYARMEFDKDYKPQTEVIGASLFKMPELSVSAPTRTSDDSVAVGGFTVPSTKVDIYLDDQYVTSTTSLKTGRYNTNITLPEAEQYNSYNIKAVASTSTGDKEAQTSIMYDGNTPMLNSLTLEYYEHEELKKFDMFNTEGVRPNITFLPSAKLKFKASFEDNSRVENVAVVSTRGNTKKHIEAKWSEKEQCFVAEGQFNPDNPYYYVPGTITVEYNTKRPEIEISDTFDPATLDPFLDDRLKDSTIEVIEDTEDTYHEKIILSDELDDLIVDEIDHVITTIDTDYSDIPITDLMSEGENIYSYLFDEGSDKYVLNLDMTDPENIIMVVHDFSSSKTVKHFLSGIDNSDEWNPSKVRLGSEFLDSVSKYTGYVQDGYSIIKDDSDLRKQIAASNMTWAQKQEAYKKADELQSDRVAFMIGTMAIGALTAPIVGPSAVVFSLLFGAVTSTSDFFWQARMGQILGADNAFYCNWIIDPSGYVYEGVTSNRLEGVTTTAYWIAPDEEGNYDEANAVVWDATEYEQMNPLITDSEGRYAWNVPEGLWQVKFEKEGYEPQYSDWLPVPPPQTEVHAGLVSYAQPQVIDTLLTPDTLKIIFDKYMIPDSVYISIDGKQFIPTYRTDEKDLEGNIFANTFICKLDAPVSVGNSITVNVTGGQSYADSDMVSYSGNAVCIDLAKSITITGEAKDGNNVTADFVNTISSPFVAICAAYDGDKLAELKFIKVTEISKACTFEFEGEWNNFKLFAWDSLTGQNNLSDIKEIN